MAKVEVFIPALIRKDKNKSRIQIEASTLRELVELLSKSDFIDKDKLLDEKGEIKKLLNVYVNGKIQKNLEVKLNEGDEVSFIPAVAGG